MEMILEVFQDCGGERGLSLATAGVLKWSAPQDNKEHTHPLQTLSQNSHMWLGCREFQDLGSDSL